jgi:hypothetical protein
LPRPWGRSAADAHLLAEIVRLDRAHHRPVAGDSATGEAIKVSARTHQTLIWDRTRHVLRLRSTLRDFFPAALAAFEQLDAPETLELLAQAPDPDTASRLSKARIVRALTAANRRDVPARADRLRQVLTAPDLRQPGPVPQAYAAILAHRGSGHHRAEHSDREAWAGGGRPFWAAPGR